MGTQTQPASIRTVVLLGREERAKLERLAAAEQASSGEILRRSLRAYQPESSAQEDVLVAALLKDTNAALDKALASIDQLRSGIDATLARIDRMREAAR
jgi:hypothetical protein